MWGPDGGREPRAWREPRGVGASETLIGLLSGRGAGGAGVGWETILGVVTRCDRSRTEVARASKWLAEATSLARIEEMSCSFVRSSPFSLASAASCVDTVSSWLVIATMPETVAHRMSRVDPSPAEMVWRACGVRLGTRVGSSWRLSLVSVKTSARKARGGESLWTGEGEAGSLRRGVEDLDIAWAKAWLPGGMGGTSVIGQEWGNGR